MDSESNHIAEISDKTLLYLLLGREGGATTARIIDKILSKPYNRNQLTNCLELDYNTITYHTDLLCKHGYATKEKFENIYYYLPSKKLFNSIEDYKLIRVFLNNIKKGN